MILREITVTGMKLCAAPVTKPLGSVKRICKARHTVVFDDEGSRIWNNTTGEANALRDDDGNCMLDV